MGILLWTQQRIRYQFAALMIVGALRMPWICFGPESNVK
jgi:hypothetical protein